jgi:hypothetical protein
VLDGGARTVLSLQMEIWLRGIWGSGVASSGTLGS